MTEDAKGRVGTSFAGFRDEQRIRKEVEGQAIEELISVSELEPYEKLQVRSRQVLLVGELIDDVIADITAAEYGAEYFCRGNPRR
ncbi:MAG: hypothetical protein ABJC12_12875 [Saprospiraceae bacterium]